MNSPNNSVAKSRRSKWLRTLLWTAACLISLVTLLWQWENWRSARELSVVHRRVVERLGTDDPFAFMPPKVSDDQNYFANPVFEGWLRVTRPETGRMKYTPPTNVLLPKDFIKPEILKTEDGEIEGLDLDLWIKKRGAVSGESPATVLARELGDGDGLLPKLAEGLNKKISIMKPGPQEALETAGANPWEAAFPDFQDMNGFQRQLDLHLRSAALVGDAKKTASVAQIMLRFSEAPARGGIIGCLVPLALYGITFEALHEALSHPAWTEESLSRLQLQLAWFDDLENYEKAHACEILMMFRSLAYFREHPEALNFGVRSGTERAVTHFLAGHMPIGWHDANVAFYADCMLDQLGPPGPDAWLGATARDEKVKQRSKEANAWPNPRRILGAVAIPHVGNITHAAAETLFHRRCLIIACALEKHRLKHDAYPVTLDSAKDDLKLFELSDPALPTQPLGYRLEDGGYLLWSMGPDAKDDGGLKGKDWLWRMK
ncbi:MAG: hypothetical protein ABL974_03995 [Prosthecobacter sp.]